MTRQRDIRLLLSELAERAGEGSAGYIHIASEQLYREVEHLAESRVRILAGSSNAPASQAEVTVGGIQIAVLADDCTVTLHRWISADAERFERLTFDRQEVPEQNLVYGHCRCGSTLTRPIDDEPEAAAAGGAG